MIKSIRVEIRNHVSVLIDRYLHCLPHFVFVLCYQCASLEFRIQAIKHRFQICFEKYVAVQKKESFLKHVFNMTQSSRWAVTLRLFNYFYFSGLEFGSRFNIFFYFEARPEFKDGKVKIIEQPE